MRPEVLLMAEVVGMMVVAFVLTAVAVSQSLASTPGPVTVAGREASGAREAAIRPRALRVIRRLAGAPAGSPVLAVAVPCPRTTSMGRVRLQVDATEQGTAFQLLACDLLGEGPVTCGGACLKAALQA